MDVRKISQTTLSSLVHDLSSLCFQPSIVSIGNSAECYGTMKLPHQIYNASPENPALKTIPRNDVSHSTVTLLSARTFGPWTFITSVVRFYAAYNIDNPAMLRAKLKPATPKFPSHDISKDPFYQTTIGWTTLQFAGSNTRTGTWWHHSFDEWNEGVGGCHHFVLA